MMHIDWSFDLGFKGQVASNCGKGQNIMQECYSMWANLIIGSKVPLKEIMNVTVKPI